MPSSFKKGYLVENFRVFRLTDEVLRPIPPHYHDFHKIILFLSGDVTYVVEGKSYALAPEDIVFVAAGEVHRPIVAPNTPYSRVVIYIAPDFLAKFRRGDDDLTLCFAGRDAAVRHIFGNDHAGLLRQMARLEENYSRQGFAAEMFAEILFVEFMIMVNRAILSHDLTNLRGNGDEKIQALIDYINANLAADLSVDALAAKIYLSRFHLMRKFKLETGYSIHRYITEKRLLKAREMLASSMPVTDICYECGFNDYSVFSRSFRKMFGLSPTEWRKDKFCTAAGNNFSPSKING